jgi:hypothetical protein
MSQLILGYDHRDWNGRLIGRRAADGYVNATAMCKANRRLWADYARQIRTAEYLRALSGSMGIPIDLLMQVIRTGPNDLRGTWVHPRLAVDLARWISPHFAVWMDGWILEQLQPAPPPQPAPLPRPQPTAQQLTSEAYFRSANFQRLIWDLAVVYDQGHKGSFTPEICTAITMAGAALYRCFEFHATPHGLIPPQSADTPAGRLTGSAMHLHSQPLASDYDEHGRWRHDRDLPQRRRRKAY